MTSPLFTDAFFEGLGSSVKEVNAAETLPPICYTDLAFFKFEKEAIFAHEWLCVGREAWIPNVGDYFTTSHIGEPIVVVRNREGIVRAMSAVCQHRAMLVADGVGNARSFVCPYHHWTYSLDGQLVSTPAMDKACDFDKSQYGLPEFRIENWLGFIFIHFDVDAAPLTPRLAAVTEALKNYDLATAEGPMPDDKTRFPWNWKVMFENNNDGYHANKLHHGPLHDFVPSELVTFPELPPDTAGYFRYNGTLHKDASFNPTQKALLPIFSGLTEEDRNRMVFANVPPTLSLIVRNDMIAYIIIRTDTVEEIQADRGWLVAPGAMQERLFQEKLAINLTTSATIAVQDRGVDTLIQRGLNSRFARRGRYSWQEKSQQEFNSWLVTRYRRQWQAQRGTH